MGAPPTGPFPGPGAFPPFGWGGVCAVKVEERLNPIAIAAINSIFFISFVSFFFVTKLPDHYFLG
jgi:hypothetical protein